jgi:hypothetical protein
MNISIYNDYKIFNAGKAKNVEQLIALVKISENIVILDLINCLIDYPATSYLIDEILKQLKIKTGEKQFDIELDLTINNDKLILSWLFYGSREFNWINDSRNVPVEKIKEKINKYLIGENIKIKIILKNDDNSIFKELIL